MIRTLVYGLLIATAVVSATSPQEKAVEEQNAKAEELAELKDEGVSLEVLAAERAWAVGWMIGDPGAAS